MALNTVKTTAKRLDVSASTIYVAVRKGAIPSVRLGRCVRIREEVVSALEKFGHPTLTKSEPAGEEA